MHVKPDQTMAINSRVQWSKFITNVNGHMSKMAVMPILGKTGLNIFFSGPERPMTFGVGM